MIFQVELTAVAEAQIQQAYQWYRDRNPHMSMVSRISEYHRHASEKAQTLYFRCTFTVEYEIFPEEVRQLIYGKTKNAYRVLFTIRNMTVYVLYVRHSARAPLTPEDLENDI
jgi:hypothetical protein